MSRFKRVHSAKQKNQGPFEGSEKIGFLTGTKNAAVLEEKDTKAQ